MWETFDKNPLLKLFILAFVMLMLLYFVIVPIINSGLGPINPYSYQFSINSGNGFGIYSLLSTLAKALLILSSIGFIASIIVYFTNRLNVIETYSSGEVKVDEQSIKECDNCGLKLQIDWQCCPKCGVDINKQSSHEVERTSELNIETEEKIVQVKTEEAKDDLVERIYQADAIKEKKKNSKTKNNINQKSNRK